MINIWVFLPVTNGRINGKLFFWTEVLRDLVSAKFKVGLPLENVQLPEREDDRSNNIKFTKQQPDAKASEV